MLSYSKLDCVFVTFQCIEDTFYSIRLKKFEDTSTGLVKVTSVLLAALTEDSLIVLCYFNFNNACN